MKKLFTSLLSFCCAFISYGQNQAVDSIASTRLTDKDVFDIIQQVLHIGKKNDSATTTKKNLSIVALPGIGYALQTGWSGQLNGLISFEASTLPEQKVSSISANLTYTQFNQIIVPVYANIWTKNNQFNLVTDFRYIKYPSEIYGLGETIDPNQKFTITYSGLKFHQSIQKEFAKNLSLGIGYYYDQFWNIESLDSLPNNTSSILKAQLGNSERASGLAFKFLYDSRQNQINPQQGVYANIVYRPNFTFLGSDENWQSLLLEARAYFPIPKQSNHMLTFWGYSLLTLGKQIPPYLMLPSVGWDDNYNTGRGYIQSRFRGRDMFYLETEYRLNLTANRLLGAVFFANMQSYSGDLASSYSALKLGCGLGLRLKLSKTSGANACFDYGFGQNGSQGFFLNIGEVF
jgi:outer membrane protein assembly factor BamA